MEDFSEIKLQIAENVGYDDGAGAILSDKDLTETMLGNFVNNRYYRLVAKLLAQHHDRGEQTAKANFYKVSGAVLTASGTTLTASSAIFNNAMVGDTIYNSTDSTTAVITAYTSTTVVTVDSTITTWTVGATIYVLGHEFTLGGDAATDSRYITGVAAKYSTSDTAFTPCERRANKASVRRTGDEIFSSSNPVWYPVTIKVSGVRKKGFGILPENTTAIEKGLEITYIEMPPRLSSATDEPDLPLGCGELLIIGGTADALRKLKEFEEAREYEGEWRKGVTDMIGDYARAKVGSTGGKIRSSHNYDMRMRRR